MKFSLYDISDDLRNGLIENIPVGDIVIRFPWSRSEEDPDVWECEVMIFVEDQDQMEAYLQSKGLESR
jgi:hypothetical protein